MWLQRKFCERLDGRGHCWLKNQKRSCWWSLRETVKAELEFTCRGNRWELASRGKEQHGVAQRGEKVMDTQQNNRHGRCGDKMMSCPHMDAQTNSDRAHSNRCITQHASISMQSPTTLRHTRVVWPHPLPVALPARGGWQLRPALTSMKVLFHTRAWMVMLVMTGASGMGHSSHTQWVWSLPQL